MTQPMRIKDGRKEKKCSICKKYYRLDKFERASAGAYGVTGICKKCNNKRKKEYRRRSHIIASGISLEDFEKKLEEQNFKCAICEKRFNTKTIPMLDHDHKVWKIRGLLCTKCNPGLGFFDDSIKKLENAVAYLKKYSSLNI